MTFKIPEPVVGGNWNYYTANQVLAAYNAGLEDAASLMQHELLKRLSIDDLDLPNVIRTLKEKP